MTDFCMPSLGSDMEAGILIEWRVKPGDRIQRRDVIAVVETEKAAIEIEVYEDGTIESLLVQPGQKVAVGTVMAVIQTESEPAIPVSEKITTTAVARVFEQEKEQSFPALSVSPATQRRKVSPYARKLAAEQGIDLTTLAGTGRQGAICAADIERAAATPSGPPLKAGPTPPAEPTSEKTAPKSYQAAMRRAIATAMAKSNREIPHYYLQTRINMQRTLQWLASENEKRSIKDRLLPVIPLIRAMALALADVPELNGYWIDDRHQISEAINIGFVISLRQGGIMAPAILNADDKGQDELMAALRDLITRTRTGGLRSAEMTDATVTVTNLGDLGVETVYGIIYPPQVALVGFGKTMEQPWAESGMLGVRPVLTATLAADHRATDGHRGAQFLDALNRYLQEPEKL